MKLTVGVSGGCAGATLLRWTHVPLSSSSKTSTVAAAL